MEFTVMCDVGYEEGTDDITQAIALCKQHRRVSSTDAMASHVSQGRPYGNRVISWMEEARIMVIDEAGLALVSTRRLYLNYPQLQIAIPRSPAGKRDAYGS